jgi:predicted kinase
MKLIMTVGVSASGKTTWAKEQKHCVNINRDDIRFNIVQPGSDWTTYKFTKVNESQVTEIENVIAERAVKFETNIIISNTNLNPKTREFWKDFAKHHNYEFEIKESMFDSRYEDLYKMFLQAITLFFEEINAFLNKYPTLYN